MSRRWQLRAYEHVRPRFHMMARGDHESYKPMPGNGQLTSRARDILFRVIVLRYGGVADLFPLVRYDFDCVFDSARGCGKKTRAELHCFLTNLLKNHP